MNNNTETGGERSGQSGLSVRAAAVALLSAVLDDGKMLSQAVGVMGGLAPSDRARAQRLAGDTLRHLDACDEVLAPFLRKAPPDHVLHILRLAVTELSQPGAAAHGIVNAAVTLTRQRQASASGMVNAVLRKISDLPDIFAAQPPQKLPAWLRKTLIATYGRDSVRAFEAVQASVPPLDLTLKTSVLPEIPGAILLPTGSLRLPLGAQISALPGFEAGDWWVQDAAAALPARLLDAKPGEKVLDLCAAPGGKSLQLASTGAHVTALDVSDARVVRLRENLERTRLTADVVIADALAWEPDTRFDAILLDAPCSATGTIRRHPDLVFVKDGSELPELLALQAALIDRALGWLKPGGRLVYATCSLLPEEGEGQLEALLRRHPTVSVERPILAGISPDWITPQGGLRLRPDYWADKGGMDGFFMVRLRSG
jgi:16S rRNA (cytosine967-C5)-methyltransferase